MGSVTGNRGPANFGPTIRTVSTLNPVIRLRITALKTRATLFYSCNVQTNTSELPGLREREKKIRPPHKSTAARLTSCRPPNGIQSSTLSVCVNRMEPADIIETLVYSRASSAAAGERATNNSWAKCAPAAEAANKTKDNTKERKKNKNNRRRRGRDECRRTRTSRVCSTYKSGAEVTGRLRRLVAAEDGPPRSLALAPLRSALRARSVFPYRTHDAVLWALCRPPTDTSRTHTHARSRSSRTFP